MTQSTEPRRRVARTRRPSLLVVGAGPMRSLAFATWRRMGLHVILVDGHSQARYEHVVDEFAPFDARDSSADVDALVELGARCDGVTTLADDSQMTAATVAARLGRPGTGVEAARAARSKLLQRTRCADMGLDVPRHHVVRSTADLREFYADGPRPAVLKPVDSGGSAGVMRVSTFEEAQREWRVVRSFSPSRTLVVEDFLAGREVSVEAVVEDGSPRFVSVTDKETDGVTGFIEVSHAVRREQRERDDATRAVRDVVSALGLESGIVHAEFKVDGGRWTLVETAFRAAGDLIPDITERVTGVSLYAAQALLALGDAPLVRDDSDGARPRVARVRFLLADGHVRSFVPPARVLERLPDVKIANQLAEPGRDVRSPLGSWGRAGYAVGWGDDAGALDVQLRRALDVLADEMGVTPATREEVAGGSAA